ncbi:MAG TPA: dephospho-CoA kinase [Candidatus Omnitrophica bacterium]|nr:dephospho-CoA kinase [Candidatus Omnitrophota bacterium]
MVNINKKVYLKAKSGKRLSKDNLSLTGLIIGVTGGFGTGKTLVAGIFKKFGAYVINADEIAHELLLQKNLVYRRSVAKFGCGILNNDKTINRKKLAAVVFSSNGNLSEYQKIIHPQIIKIIKQRIKDFKSKSGKCELIVLDAPLLIETGLSSIVDKVVVVKTNKKNQHARLKNKFSTDPTIFKRLKYQLSLSEKIKLADYIIDNNTTRKNTEKQISFIWEKLFCEKK